MFPLDAGRAGESHPGNAPRSQVIEMLKKFSSVTRYLRAKFETATTATDSIGAFGRKMVPSPFDGAGFESPFGDLLGFVLLHEQRRAESHGFGL